MALSVLKAKPVNPLKQAEKLMLYASTLFYHFSIFCVLYSVGLMFWYLCQGNTFAHSVWPLSSLPIYIFNIYTTRKSMKTLGRFVAWRAAYQGNLDPIEAFEKLPKKYSDELMFNSELMSEFQDFYWIAKDGRQQKSRREKKWRAAFSDTRDPQEAFELLDEEYKMELMFDADLMKLFVECGERSYFGRVSFG